MRTDWILDIILAVVGIVLFGLMMLVLPQVLPGGFAYIAAFLIFIIYLSIAGLTIILKNVGKNPAQKKVKKAETQ
ncbi:MAG TPA: hypothetical protein O0X39_01675 [Methanocorpusculum sp.]|nr:hypothetical protein [Methanocorpusculum sp.]